jgi:hypothetical protein
MLCIAMARSFLRHLGQRLLTVGFGTGALFAFAAEPAHPILSVSGSGSGAGSILSGYTETQFLDFVPQQSPRNDSYGFAPAVVSGDTGWSWSTSAPNQIRSTPSNTVFPNTNYSLRTDAVPVLSGKTVQVSYYLAAGSTSKKSLVFALIDYHKRAQLRSFLNTLAAAYIQSGTTPATRDDRYARRIAVALDAWANHVPDYYMTGKNSATFISAAGFTQLTSDIQRASDHNGLAHEWQDDELIAFDAIYDSQALVDLSREKGYDVRQHIKDGLFCNIGDFIKDRVPVSVAIATNLSGPFTVLAETARVLNRPDYIGWMNSYLDATVRQKIMRDGVLGEGIGYSTGYLNENLDGARSVRDYFLSRPADTPQLVLIQAAAGGYVTTIQSGIAAWNAARLPNGELPSFGDTPFGAASARNAGNSTVLPAYGHLALGAGSGAQAVQLNQNFSDDANHMRADVSAFVLWAFGNEMVGNIRYYNGTPGRQFDEQILSHNAVTIDRTNMSRDGWTVGARGHAFTSGNLVLLEPGNNGLAVSELDGSRPYANKASRYQRIMILNTVDLNRPYVVDVFRIAGGTTHDYVLHGSIRFDQSGESSFPLAANSATYPLLEGGEVWKEPASSGDSFPYYGFWRNVSSGTAPGNFQITYRDTSTAHRDLRLWMTDDGTATVHLGRTPNPERTNNTPANFYKYWRPSVIVRRRITSGTQQSLFASVVEPMKAGASTIRSVERVPLANAGLDAVGLKVTFTDGRADTYLVNLNNPRVAGASTGSTTITTTDGQFTLTGRIGLRVDQPTGDGRLWTVAAGEFKTGGHNLSPTGPSYAGNIVGVTRKASGAANDAFVTNATLPIGTTLKGRQLSLTFGTYQIVGSSSAQKNISEMFQIDHVEQANGQTQIVLAADPQLTISGNTTTELMAPQRTFTGQDMFEILLSSSAPFSAASAATTITTQPSSQTVTAGGSVTFTVAATASGTVAYQWSKNGVPIAGATNTTLALANVTAAQSGDYTVTITGAGGSTTSSVAKLTIAAVAPTIITPPVSQTIAPGGSATFSVTVAGSDAVTFQWRKNGAAISGATNSTLTLLEVTAANAADYTVAVAGSGGTTTSAIAVLNVTTPIPGRIINLSVRGGIVNGREPLIGGFVVTGGSKPLLIRGIGPQLADFGVSGVLLDPKLEIHASVNGQDGIVAANDNWADTDPSLLRSAFIKAGAFALDATRKDAALLHSADGGRSVHIRSADMTSGVALLEVYDAGDDNTVRLVNVSARNRVGTGANVLIAGFVISGNVPRALLIRGVGPTLAGFGVTGSLLDPKLEIHTTKDGRDVLIASNDNWSEPDPSALEDAFDRVGAFQLPAGSADAALLVTLPPGAYTAVVSGVGNAEGEALVEIYDAE